MWILGSVSMLHLCMSRLRKDVVDSSAAAKLVLFLVILLTKIKASDLEILEFDSYSEAWLDFILNCRSGNDTTKYDLVIGGVANDKVFNTIELFFDGLIVKTEAIERLRYEKPNLQICFRTEKALKLLHFERSENV